MRREIARPKEAIVKIKQGKFDMLDVFIILGSAGIGLVTKHFVPMLLQIPYIGFYPLAFYLLLSPSDVPNKKNYQVALQLLLKDRKVYHAINPSKEDNHEV